MNAEPMTQNPTVEQLLEMSWSWDARPIKGGHVWAFGEDGGGPHHIADCDTEDAARAIVAAHKEYSNTELAALSHIVVAETRRADELQHERDAAVAEVARLHKAVSDRDIEIGRLQGKLEAEQAASPLEIIRTDGNITMVYVNGVTRITAESDDLGRAWLCVDYVPDQSTRVKKWPALSRAEEAEQALERRR